MRKSLFIGACDKVDIVLYIAKLLEATESRVLVVDATKEQRYKYSIPQLDEPIQLVETNNFDVASNCFSEKDVIKLLDKIKLDQYDYILIDTDREDFVQEWKNIDQHFLVSSYDNYTIQKNKELIDSFFKLRDKETVTFSQITYDLDVLIDEDYISSSLARYPIHWDEDSYLVPFDEQNYVIKIENQYSNRIKLNGLSRSYKKTLLRMTQNVSSLDFKTLKRAMKLAERRG